MSTSLFDRFLSTPEMMRVFGDEAIVGAMLRFEAALSQAQADEGLIPAEAAHTIAASCQASQYDIAALVTAGRRAGSLAIPLVKALTQHVAQHSSDAARHVHWGSTSQDVLDTAMVLVTQEALTCIRETLWSLIERLFALAVEHLETPVLARTLMQPAQVTSFGFKLIGWTAPLVRAYLRLQTSAEQALQLQLGGAVGTLSVLGDHGQAIAARMATTLGLKQADAAWHTQRDEWVRLGAEIAVLAGSLGKIATDLSLMAQGEIAELAEPSGNGRGGSSAMPHKRNPVSSMLTLAAAARAPQQVATLFATMAQQHERGLGNWQAELAEWPGLFVGVHSSLSALNEAFAGLIIDKSRMRENIDSLQGLVFAESISIYLANAIGRPQAHALLESLTRQTVSEGRHLFDVLAAHIQTDEALQKHIDLASLRDLFNPLTAAGPGKRIAERQLAQLRQSMAMSGSNPAGISQS